MKKELSTEICNITKSKNWSILTQTALLTSENHSANYIFVSGEVKLIDFGIDKAIRNDTTHMERDLQVSFSRSH